MCTCVLCILCLYGLRLRCVLILFWFVVFQCLLLTVNLWLVLAEVQEAEHDPQVTICTLVRTFKVVHITCDVHVYNKNICVHVYFSYYAYNMVCG